MNNTQNTAKHQLKAFLRNSKSFKYKLNPFHLAILEEIAYCQDLPKEACCETQETMAKNCRMSVRAFRDYSKELLKMNLILRAKNWKLYWHILSGTITGDIINIRQRK